MIYNVYATASIHRTCISLSSMLLSTWASQNIWYALKLAKNAYRIHVRNLLNNRQIQRRSSWKYSEVEHSISDVDQFWYTLIYYTSTKIISKYDFMNPWNVSSTLDVYKILTVSHIHSNKLGANRCRQIWKLRARVRVTLFRWDGREHAGSGFLR